LLLELDPDPDQGARAIGSVDPERMHVLPATPGIGDGSIAAHAVSGGTAIAPARLLSCRLPASFRRLGLFW